MDEKIARLIECEQIIRRCRAEQFRLIAEVNVDEWARVDVAMALQLSRVDGDYLVEWATRVVKVFPDVVDALEAGVISERSAHAMVDATTYYSEELAQRAVSKTLETAQGRCSQQLRR